MHRLTTRATPQVAAVALMLTFSGSVAGQDIPKLKKLERIKDSVGTLVYDAKIREFRCWSEGVLRADARSYLCDTTHGWHPLNANFYFVRGQSISVIVMNAVAEDIFSLDVKADDLAEPVVPVQGALSELPKLLPIPPAPTVFAGVGASFVAGATPIRPTTVYRIAVSAEEKDFKAWVQSTLIDPFAAKEVADLLSVDIDVAITQAAASGAVLTEIRSVQARLDAIAAPGSMGEWISRVADLVRLIDLESALRSTLVARGLTTAGATINAALAASRSTVVQRAMAVDPGDFIKLANALATGLGDTPYARINDLRVVNQKFESGEPLMLPIVDGLNAALGALDASTVLARTKTNLIALADAAQQVQLAETRREALANLKGKLDAQKNSPTGIYTLQTEWANSAATTIAKAAMLNASAKTLPLEAPYDLMPVGQWFVSKTVTLTVKQGQRVPLFDVGGVSDTTRAAIAGGDTPAAKAVQIAAADLAAARVLQFAVYNLYRFKVGLGFLYSTADDKLYTVDKLTTGTGSSAVTQQFIDQTRDRDYNILPSVNVMIFPFARPAFPWRPRYRR